MKETRAQRKRDSPIRLSDDIVGKTVSASVPSGGDLSTDESIELDGLGDENPGSSLELDEELSRRLSPDVALVSLLPLELVGVGGGNLDRLEIVVELDLLVEGLLLGIVTVEELGLCDEEGTKRKGESDKSVSEVEKEVRERKKGVGMRDERRKTHR